MIGAPSGALAGFEAFREIALNTTLRVLLTFPLIVLGAYRLGLTGAALGLAGGALVGLVLYVISTIRVSRRHQCVARSDGLRTELRVLTGFSLPAYVSGAMVTPMIWGGTVDTVPLPGRIRADGPLPGYVAFPRHHQPARRYSGGLTPAPAGFP